MLNLSKIRVPYLKTSTLVKGLGYGMLGGLLIGAGVTFSVLTGGAGALGIAAITAAVLGVIPEGLGVYNAYKFYKQKQEINHVIKTRYGGNEALYKQQAGIQANNDKICDKIADLAIKDLRAKKDEAGDYIKIPRVNPRFNLYSVFSKRKIPQDSHYAAVKQRIVRGLQESYGEQSPSEKNLFDLSKVNQDQLARTIATNIRRGQELKRVGKHNLCIKNPALLKDTAKEATTAFLNEYVSKGTEKENIPITTPKEPTKEVPAADLATQKGNIPITTPAEPTKDVSAAKLATQKGNIPIITPEEPTKEVSAANLATQKGKEEIPVSRTEPRAPEITTLQPAISRPTAPQPEGPRPTTPQPAISRPTTPQPEIPGPRPKREGLALSQESPKENVLKKARKAGVTTAVKTGVAAFTTGVGLYKALKHSNVEHPVEATYKASKESYSTRLDIKNLQKNNQMICNDIANVVIQQLSTSTTEEGKKLFIPQAEFHLRPWKKTLPKDLPKDSEQRQVKKQILASLEKALIANPLDLRAKKIDPVILAEAIVQDVKKADCFENYDKDTVYISNLDILGKKVTEAASQQLASVAAAAVSEKASPTLATSQEAARTSMEEVTPPELRLKRAERGTIAQPSEIIPQGTSLSRAQRELLEARTTSQGEVRSMFREGREALIQRFQTQGEGAVGSAPRGRTETEQRREQQRSESPTRDTHVSRVVPIQAPKIEKAPQTFSESVARNSPGASR